jgi:membrane-bound ClpP family serine protease
VSALAAVGLAWWKLGPLEAMASLGVGAAVGGVVVWYLPRTRAAQAMVLNDVQTVRAADPTLAALLGAQGETRTPLRPAGSVEIAGRLVDVVSEGRFIDVGTRVEVLRVEGVRVVVGPVRDFRGA